MLRRQSCKRLIGRVLVDSLEQSCGVQSSPGLSTTVRTKATLPDLPYDYSALSPVIIPEIMELHHSKHHQAYVTNLNVALEKLAEAEHKGDVNAMIGLQSAIKFNGGGVH